MLTGNHRISEEPISSIFKIWLEYLTLKMEKLHFSKTSATIYYTTRRHVSRELSLHKHHYETSNIVLYFRFVWEECIRDITIYSCGKVRLWVYYRAHSASPDDDEWIIFSIRWMNIDREKRRYSLCHFILHKIHIVHSGIDTGPPGWQSGGSLL